MAGTNLPPSAKQKAAGKPLGYGMSKSNARQMGTKPGATAQNPRRMR